MKKLAALFLLFAPFWVHAQGTYFLPHNFKKAQAIAQKLKRPLLIDFTAKWCNPCKVMEREFWADPTVGEKVNALFVVVQMDMDNAETKFYAKQYAVEGIPNVVCLDVNGEFVQRMQGYGGYGAAARHLNLLMAITSPDKATLILEAEKQYEQHPPKTLADLTQYLQVRQMLGMSNESIIAAYLKKLPDAIVGSDSVLTTVSLFNDNVDGAVFSFLFTHREKAIVRSGLMAGIMQKFREAVQLEDKQTLSRVQKANKRLQHDEAVATMENAYFELEYIKKTADEKEFHKVAMAFAKRYATQEQPNVTKQMAAIKQYYESGRVKKAEYVQEFLAVFERP